MYGMHPMDIATANYHARMIANSNQRFLEKHCIATGLTDEGHEIFFHRITLEEELLSVEVKITVKVDTYSVRLHLFDLSTDTKFLLSYGSITILLMELIGEEVYTKASTMVREHLNNEFKNNASTNSNSGDGS